jgi:hypothetical protein
MTSHLHIARPENPEEEIFIPEPYRTEHQSGFQVKQSLLDETQKKSRLEALQQLYEGRVTSATEVLPGALQREALRHVRKYFKEVMDDERPKPLHEDVLDSYCNILEKCAGSQTQENYPEVYRFVQRLWEYMRSQATRNALERICITGRAEEMMESRGQSTPVQLLIHLMDILEDEPANNPYRTREPYGKSKIRLISKREEKQVRVMQDIADLSEFYPWGLVVLDHVIDKNPDKRERTREWYQTFINLMYEAGFGLKRENIPEDKRGINAAHVTNLCSNLARAAYKAPDSDSLRLHRLTQLDPNAANDLVRVLTAFERSNGRHCPLPLNAQMLSLIDLAIENNGTFRERPVNSKTGRRDLLYEYHNPISETVIRFCDRMIEAMDAKLEAERKAAAAQAPAQKNS